MDDLAAIEIDKLGGVLVFDGQAHEELEARRSAEHFLDIFAGFQVSRNCCFGHADNDWLVICGFHRKALTSCRQAKAMETACQIFALGAEPEGYPLAREERLRRALMRDFVGRFPLFSRLLRQGRLSVD